MCSIISWLRAPAASRNPAEDVALQRRRLPRSPFGATKWNALCSRQFADSVSYFVLRLADDSFLHVSFHSHGDDQVNPIASTAAFEAFRRVMLNVDEAMSTIRLRPSLAPLSLRSVKQQD